MIRIGEDQETIYITRGDQPTKEFNRLAFYYPIYNFTTEKEENYMFQLEDKITFVVVNKKGYTKEEIFKKDYTLRDLGYTEPTEVVEIPITAEDTEKFPLTNKTKTYWFEISLGDDITILGHDETGGKKIVVYPNADD